MSRIALSTSIPAWLWIDLDTRVIERIELNAQPEMFSGAAFPSVHDAETFADLGDDVLKQVEEFLADAPDTAFPHPEVLR